MINTKNIVLCLIILVAHLFSTTVQIAATTAESCIIYIARHGETDWNKQGRVQGHTNTPLNQEGEKQALQLREQFANITFSRAFSSDLLRAYKTAELILDSNAITIVQAPELRERNFGIWEGCLTSELQDHIKKINYSILSKTECLSYTWDPTVESHIDVYKRIQKFINSVAKPSMDGPLLFASHGGVLRAILYNLDFKPNFRWRVENCAYLKLQVSNDGQIAILETNGVHLIPDKNALYF